VLDRLQGTEKLFCTLLYGTGLRLMEGLRLRVKDLDFSLGEVVVHDGKGAKDRRTMLPQSIRPALEEHLKQVAALHRSDLAEDMGGSTCPMPSSGSIPGLPPNGPGSTSFRRPDGTATRKPAP
jgi:integrase